MRWLLIGGVTAGGLALWWALDRWEQSWDATDVFDVWDEEDL
jgi:hypothetical protein